MRKQGIDVSYVQGAIDWSAVTADFAMIRACYGWDNDRQIDSRLYENARGAKENGTPYGLFHYSYARTPDDALKEADFFLRVIKGLKLSLIHICTSFSCVSISLFSQFCPVSPVCLYYFCGAMGGKAIIPLLSPHHSGTEVHEPKLSLIHILLSISLIIRPCILLSSASSFIARSKGLDFITVRIAVFRDSPALLSSRLSCWPSCLPPGVSISITLSVCRVSAVSSSSAFIRRLRSLSFAVNNCNSRVMFSALSRPIDSIYCRSSSDKSLRWTVLYLSLIHICPGTAWAGYMSLSYIPD